MIHGRVDAFAQLPACSTFCIDVMRWLVKKSMASACSPPNDRSSTMELRGEPCLGSFRSSS